MPTHDYLLVLLLALTPGERAAEDFAKADPVVGSIHVRLAWVDPGAGSCQQASDSALRLWATASSDTPIAALRVAATKPSYAWLYHVQTRGEPPRLVTATSGLTLYPQRDGCLMLTEAVRPSCSKGERFMLALSSDTTPPQVHVVSQRGDGVVQSAYTYATLPGGASWVWTLPPCGQP